MLSANLLIIEDSVPAQHWLKKMLDKLDAARLGFEVHVSSAYALEDGLALITRDIDLVILDLSLPNGSGISVLRKVCLKAKEAEAMVLVVTGDESPMTSFVACSVGAFDYQLKRDLTPDGFLASVRQALVHTRVDLRLRSAGSHFAAAQALNEVETASAKEESFACNKAKRDGK